MVFIGVVLDCWGSAATASVLVVLSAVGKAYRELHFCPSLGPKGQIKKAVAARKYVATLTAVSLRGAYPTGRKWWGGREVRPVR